MWPWCCKSAALYPHMSVRENMAFGLKMRRTSGGEIERRVKEAADVLAIGPLLDRRPAELSGGQRRRVAIGRAIVRAPRVFLFDEPLSDLDPPLRAQLRAEIAKLHTRLGATMIYVTHDQAEAMTLGQRIGVMEGGTIQQIDTPESIYHRPASAFVASFIGSPGMNLISGEVRAGVFRWRDSANGKPSEGGIAVGAAIADGAVTLGVRPSDLSLGSNGLALGGVRLGFVERLGHETLVHFELAGGSHVARLPANADVRPREDVQLSVRPDRLHFFSAADGRRLN
jgi:ABC-type sugar transport system ATPase subunit